VRSPRTLLAPAVALSMLVACTESGPDQPFTLEPASVAVNLVFSAGATAGGPRSAYLKTDQISLKFSAGSSIRDERAMAYAPADTETHLPMYVSLRQSTEELQLNVELRAANDLVFRGTATAELRVGRTTTVTVTLDPVVAGVVGPDGLPVLTAYGQSLKLSGAAIFATGDTIDASAASWTGLDPAIASIDEEGTVVARSDGTARAIAHFESFSDTVEVVVRAEVASVTVTPSGQMIPVGSQTTYTAILRDSNGNPITGRTVNWSTTDPDILTIDQNGTAKAVGLGNALVIATVSNAAGDVPASTVPGAPLTEDLTVVLTTSPITATFGAGVYPNGGSTDTWFEWAPVSTAAQPSLTVTRNIGAGVIRVPIGTTVQGLLPATSYTVKVVATNSAGRHESEGIFFTTGLVPPTVKTTPATGPTPPTVTLNGTANANGSPTTVWFEWGADPTNATNRTPEQTIQGFSTANITDMVPSGPVGSTWYFRIVARNAGGTVAGAFLPWTVLPGPPPATPVVTTIPASISTTFVTLLGEVNPSGWATNGWFEWGTDPLLSTFTATSKVSLGSNIGPQPLSTGITGLVPNATYYYRAAGENTWGFVRGSILSFVAPPDPNVDPPDATTLSPTLTGDKVVLNGSGNPNGSAAEAWFEYGTDPTLSVFSTTAVQSIGSGTGTVTFSAPFTGPAAPVRYYRAVVRNAGGTTRGAIVTF
jgi:hypothetical protein